MVRILPFSPEDTEAVFALILGIQQDEFGIPITRADQPDLASVGEFYQRGSGNFWVAVADNRVVGTIALVDLGGGDAALRKMFVAAPYRGRQHGVALSLLGTLLAWGRKRGLQRIFLGTTAQFLAAHRFYEKNGFTEIDPAILPPSFPWMKVDTKFYRLDL